jgi:hypothetical protein
MTTQLPQGSGLSDSVPPDQVLILGLLSCSLGAFPRPGLHAPAPIPMFFTQENQGNSLLSGACQGFLGCACNQWVPCYTGVPLGTLPSFPSSSGKRLGLDSANVLSCQVCVPWFPVSSVVSICSPFIDNQSMLGLLLRV